MKVALAMKSNFAYERLSSDLRKYEVSHLVSIEDIQDSIQYFQPDLVVLDKDFPDFEESERILLRFNIHLIHFESDFDEVVKEVHTQSVFYTDAEEEEGKKYVPDHSKYLEQLQQKVNKEPEKQKVVYKEKIVEKEIEKLAYTSIPPKLIVIGSLWTGAGSTTVATNLARSISNRGLRVSVVEHPLNKAYLFDYLDIHNKEDPEKGRIYFDHAQIIKNEGVVSRDRNWLEQGISWYVNDSRFPPVDSFSYEDMLKLIYSISSPIKIVDISNMWNQASVQDFMHHADEVFVCIQPDPIKIDSLAKISIDGQETTYQRPEYRTLSFLKELEDREGVGFQYITTHMNSVISSKKWSNDYLLRDSLSSIDFIPYQDLSEKVWESTFLYDDDRYREFFESSFQPLLKRILPVEFQRLHVESQNDKKGVKSLLRKITMK